jgi:hypothetical protein
MKKILNWTPTWLILLAALTCTCAVREKAATEKEAPGEAFPCRCYRAYVNVYDGTVYCKCPGGSVFCAHGHRSVSCVKWDNPTKEVENGTSI